MEAPRRRGDPTAMSTSTEEPEAKEDVSTAGQSMRIVSFATRRPVTVTMLMAAVIIFGLISFDKLPINLLPDISYPTLTVRTEYPGTAPNEVESLVSSRIEDAVSVISNVMRVTSISRAGVSDVTIEFAWKTNMDFAALDVREKLDLVSLPNDAKKPVLLRFDPSLDPIMRIGVSGEEGLIALRLAAEEDMKRRIENIEGVAAVKVSGGLEEEIHVEIDEAKLASLQIPISTVVSRLEQENVNLTGGSLKDGEAEYLVRTLNEFKSVDEIGDIVLVARDKALVMLRDVARIMKSNKERTVITRINGKESVEVAVYKEAGANTVTVARRVHERIDELRKDFAKRSSSVRLTVVMDQSRFIEDAVREVLHAAVYGGILAVFVLYLFLRDVKSTAIIASSIPLSIVATFFFMYTAGVTLNIMSLGGLALGIGMLVDNSIVVLESIDRYRQEGLGPYEAANRGTSDVGSAVAASTWTTIFVFVPIIFVRGIAGQLFTDQALTVAFSLLVSLGVALTWIPMLASLKLERQAAGAPAPRSRALLLALFVPVGLALLLASVFPVIVENGLRWLPAASTHGTIRSARAFLEAYRDVTFSTRVTVPFGLPGLYAAVSTTYLNLVAWLWVVGGGVLCCAMAWEDIRRTIRAHPWGALLGVVGLWLLTWGILYLSSNFEAIRAWFPGSSATSANIWRSRGKPFSWTDYTWGFILYTMGHLATFGPWLMALVWLWFLGRAGAALGFIRAAEAYAKGVGRIGRLLLAPVRWGFDLCFGAVRAAYVPLVRSALRHNVFTVLCAAGALGFAAFLALGLGMELIPEMSQGEFFVDVTMPIGTPLSATSATMGQMEACCANMPRGLPEIAEVYAIVGSTTGSGSMSAEERENLGQINVVLKHGATRADEERVMDYLREKFRDIPAVSYKFSRPTYFSFRTPVEVDIGGYNLRTLATLAARVREAMRSIPGLADVRASTEGGSPEIQITFNRQRVAQLGLDISTIGKTIREKIQGDVATQFSRRDRKIDIRVRALEGERDTVEDIQRLSVANVGGSPVPLSAIATVHVERGPSEIRRVNQERVAIVTANLRGRDLRAAIREIEARLATIPRPADFSIRMSGQSQEMAVAYRSMFFAISLAAFLVYLVMASQFESLLHPLVIMVAIPFAFVGVAVALFLTGKTISVVVLIGVVMLAGIAVNDAIVLVDCVNQRRRAGLTRYDAIIEAGRLRLRPILMTTATTVLGLLPLALGIGEGSELRAPMGIAVIGGMVSSTLLTLVFVPTLYDIVESAKDGIIGFFRGG